MLASLESAKRSDMCTDTGGGRDRGGGVLDEIEPASEGILRFLAVVRIVGAADCPYLSRTGPANMKLPPSLFVCFKQKSIARCVSLKLLFAGLKTKAIQT